MQALQLSELIARTRRISDDAVAPYFVSDQEITEYLNQAEIELCKQKVLTSTKRYYATVNEPWLDLTVGGRITVLEVKRIWFTDPDNAANFREGQVQSDRIDTIPRYLPNHMPAGIALGGRTGYGELIPTPDKAYIIDISMVHMPENTMESPQDEPSVDPRWQTFLPFGAAMYAMRGSETEHFSPGRLQSVEATWLSALHDAYVETKQREWNTRPVQFNGNGVW
jgi:hypothetical protein